MPYEKVGKNDPVCIADEVPFDIPNSWEWVRLGSIGETNIGLTYKPSDKVDEGKGIAVLRSNNIQKGKMDYSDLIYVSCNVPERAMINKGDILICARNGSRTLVGKSAIVDINGMAFGAFMAKYTSMLSGLLNKYVLTFIESPVFRRQLDGVKTETINQITQDMLKEQLIPMPPLGEQQRIIRKLEEIMPHIEKYEVAYSETAILNNEFPELLKKSILQKAVQGKLVPQNENDEPASVLLERIRAEKQALIKAGKIKKDKNESVIFRRDNSHYEKLNGIERCIDDEIPFEVPESWTWCRATSLLTISSGDGLTSQEMDNGMYPVFGGNGITGYHSKYNVTEPTLVVGRVGFYCGSTHITPSLAWVTDNAFITMFDRKNIDIYWLKLFLDSAELRKRSSSTAQPVISGKTVYPLLIPLPPLEEQHRIVSAYNSLVPFIEQL